MWSEVSSFLRASASLCTCQFLSLQQQTLPALLRYSIMHGRCSGELGTTQLRQAESSLGKHFPENVVADSDEG